MGKSNLNILALTVATLASSLALADDSSSTTKTEPSSSIFNESAQAKSEGFVEGSKLKLLIRNYYFNRDFRSSYQNRYGTKKAQSYREEWAQGFITTYQSGFTEGTVGFGVDAFGLYGFKLDSGRGRAGTEILPKGSESGKAPDNYGRAGGAVKVRISNTVLKYGQQMVNTPVLTTDDGRLLPETVTGFLLTSNEIKNLTFNMGHFTTLDARNQSYRDSVSNSWGLYREGSHKQGKGLKRLDIIGGTYQFTPNLSASVYYSDLKDIWKKKYLGISYDYPINDNQAIGTAFNYYNTKSQGPVKELSRKEYNGKKLDSDVWSLQLYYAINGHKFTVAHQRVTGDGPGDPYGPDGNSTMILANSVQYSDFNNPGERSWQIRYDLNMAEYGVPGLSFMTRYLRGTNISEYLRKGNMSGGKATEREHNIEAKYVVQTGPAKDLSFRVRYAINRSSGLGTDINELRVITEYPLDILGLFKK